MKLRKATKEDIIAILDIHDSLFDYKYSYENYENELYLDIANFFVLEDDEIVVGYFITHTVFEQMEIIMIAINKEFQGNGYGKFLMSTIEYLALKNECSNIIIEVETTNSSAIGFYEAFEFVRIDIRKNYYGKYKDAYIYRKEVK